MARTTILIAMEEPSLKACSLCMPVLPVAACVRALSPSGLLSLCMPVLSVGCLRALASLTSPIMLKRLILFLLSFFLFWMLLFSAVKWLFLCYNREEYAWSTSDLFDVLLHGWSMDASTAGYLMVVPWLTANHVDASLIHEAAIGKIAGDQLTKLMTLGLTEKEAEAQIINGFLK